jgi:hypothetical protein
VDSDEGLHAHALDGLQGGRLTSIVAIALQVIPEVAQVVQAVTALTKKYPALTPAQIQGLVADVTSQANTAFDDVLAKIAAAQKGS